MNTIILSSREFNQDTGRTKKTANNGPAHITDRGCSSHALLTIEQFEQMSGQKRNIVDILAMPLSTGSGLDIKFEPPRIERVVKPAGID